MANPTRTDDQAGQDLPSPADLERTLKLLSALANPARLLVLFALRAGGSLAVTELSELTGQEQSAMSHQLAVLRRAALIVAERDGKRHLYRLADEHVIDLLETALAHATGHG